MGRILNSLIGKSNTLDEPDFKPFDHTNPALKSDTVLELKISEVSNKSEMLKVEQAVRSGDIIILKIGRLTGGLTKEELLTYIHDAVKETDGDIVQKENNEYIITPSSIRINRSKL